MASIKIILRPDRSSKDGEHPVILRVIHQRKPKYFFTGYSATEAQWNEEKKRFYKTHPQAKEMNAYLDKLENRAKKIAIGLDTSGRPYKCEDIISKLSNTKSYKIIYEYISVLIDEFNSAGRFGNAKAYKMLIPFLKTYTGKEILYFSDIDYTLLKKIENTFYSKGYKVNGLSVYFRTLRAVFNRAIKEEVIDEAIYPFKKYVIKSEFYKTQKRAIDFIDIIKIRDIELKEKSFIWHCRNYFMFSFYMIGINFIDTAYLKVSDINNNRLAYKRSKTGKAYSIEIPGPAMNIIKLYGIDKKASEDYIFSIITRTEPMDVRKQIENTRSRYDKNLKKLGKMCEIDMPLSSYVARHSWATIAKRMNIPIYVISESLGHDDIKTTQVYLDSLDSNIIDEANKMIISGGG